jgi:hypothetical protein
LAKVLLLYIWLKPDGFWVQQCGRESGKSGPLPERPATMPSALAVVKVIAGAADGR